MAGRLRRGHPHHPPQQPGALRGVLPRGEPASYRGGQQHGTNLGHLTAWAPRHSDGLGRTRRSAALGEREKLLRGLRQPGDFDFDVEAVAASLRAGSVDYWAARRLLLEGPVELGAELIGHWQPAKLWGSAWWVPQLVARFDVAAHPLV